METNAVGSGKEDSELDRHGKILYEWLDTSKVSRVRMLLQWQSAAGLSYVAAVHHRAVQCFRYEGNSLHGNESAVTPSDFQAAIKSRHHVGSTGMSTTESQSTSNDFANV